ncbi:MAG: hypothetical protein GX752_04390 [Clostridium sp.]|nr:hypothetical protein [Clostridium sp.]
MFKKVIWPILLFISISLSIVFVMGFITSINVSKSDEGDYTEKTAGNSNNIPEEEDKTPEDSSEILILGDSIGFGVGDEENLGIGNRYVDLIKEEGENKKGITNISVPGYESSELVRLIKSGENVSSISSANLIIISIGGNDLNRLEYDDNLTLNIAFKEALKNYKENLKFIIKEIRAINPDAQLVCIGLYDPSGNEEPEKTRLLLEWNYETRLIVGSDIKFAYIPTYELFEYHLNEYLFLDEFHPSGSGYQVIAEEIYKILN